MEIVEMLMAVVKGGGVFIYLILFILIFGVAIVVERTLFISRSKINGTALLTSIREALKADNREQALAACSVSNAPLSLVFARGLNEAVSPIRKETLQGAVDEALWRCSRRLKRGSITFRPSPISPISSDCSGRSSA